MNLQTAQKLPSSEDAVDSARVLLRDLIDYAGLFPPASLAMAPAVANCGAYSRSEYNWILGRFILPVARLAEFEKTLTEGYAVAAASPLVATPGSGARWTLSVLPGENVSADLARIPELNDRFAASSFPVKAEIKSVEVKIASPQDVERLSKIIPAELETYFEIPLTASERDCIAAVANCGRRAKIRTGGEAADKFPAPESVVEFIRLCAAANVPFKATAGLHHPLCSVHRFTYQPESPSGIMHGFLNVFLAAAFLRAGMEPELALQLIKEQSAQAFHFDSEGVIWREHRLLTRDIAAARRGFSISFGSCSFTEPIEDLRSLLGRAEAPSPHNLSSRPL
jgi:hypothetical protein